MRGQRQAVMNHLLTHGEITSMEAYELYGCTRLAALIFDFRHMGYKISTLEEKGKNRFGESTKYARYVMSKENRYKGKVPVDNNNIDKERLNKIKETIDKNLNNKVPNFNNQESTLADNKKLLSD